MAFAVSFDSGKAPRLIMLVVLSVLMQLLTLGTRVAFGCILEFDPPVIAPPLFGKEPYRVDALAAGGLEYRLTFVDADPDGGEQAITPPDGFPGLTAHHPGDEDPEAYEHLQTYPAGAVPIV